MYTQVDSCQCMAKPILYCKVKNKYITEKKYKDFLGLKIVFLETDDNENMTTQNLSDVAKAVLRGKFRAMQSYLKKQEKHQIDNLTLQLK